MERVWVRMTEIYAYEWTNRYGTKPSRGWLEILKSLTLNEIRFGFDQLIKTDRYADRPPSPIAFRELCLNNERKLTTEQENEIKRREQEIEENFNEAHKIRLNDYYKKLGIKHQVGRYQNESNHKAA